MGKYCHILKSWVLAWAMPGPRGSGTMETAAERPTAPVTLDGVALLRVVGVSAYPAEQRARDIGSRIQAIAANASVSTESLRVVELSDRSRILAGDRMILSLFKGVIFSLGSSSVIANVITGYSMTYRRAFCIGNRVKIGDHLGDVMEIRLLVTHLRMPKNEEMVVPNSEILNHNVINDSTLARNQGLILYTIGGIGHDPPWRQVEAMLLAAADRTPGLRKQPPPFVLQKSLGDFAVTYEINVY